MKTREQMIEELEEWQREEDAADAANASEKFVETDPTHIKVTPPPKKRV